LHWGRRATLLFAVIAAPFVLAQCARRDVVERGDTNIVKTTPSAQTSAPRSSQPNRQEYTTWTQVRIKVQAPVRVAAGALETCFVLNVTGITDGEGIFRKAAADIHNMTNFNEDCILVIWGAPYQDMRVVREIWRDYGTGRMVVVTEGDHEDYDLPYTGGGVLVRISREYVPKQVMITWDAEPSMRGFTKPIAIAQAGKLNWEQLIRAAGTPNFIP